MPEAPRRSRPLPRHADVYTEADGLFGRLADLVIENPARAGGLAAMVLVSGAIVTNAAYFQTAQHPDPFFVTRPAVVAPEAKPASQPAASSQTEGPQAARVVSTVPVAQTAEPAAPRPGVDAAAPSDQQVATIEPMPPALPKARPVSPPVAHSQPAAPPAARNAPTASTPAAPRADATTGLVADTQRALADRHYYDGPIDGILGTGTKAAISSFEMRIGLIPTGQPSRQLLDQIRRGYPSATAPASTGSIAGPDAQLKRVQHALNEIGYGPIPEDGRDGAKTAAAIRRFEADNRLPPTGKAGNAVTAKLVLIGAMPAR